MPARSQLQHLQHIDAIYHDHNGWLRSWLHARLGCSQQAADFAQDTFVRLLSGLNTQPHASTIHEPRSYLATIANRVMIDHFRKKNVEKAYLTALAHLPESEEISPEQRMVVLECLQELDAMLAGLGPNVRQAFLLSQLQGTPYAEIATELGVSVSSVKKYMAKATASCLIYALEHGL